MRRFGDQKHGMTAPSPTPDDAPSLAELYLGFAQISMSAFGGALPWARRILVERRGWMEPEDFASTLALCQFLPGPNIVNLSIAVGQRFRGVSGALAAFAGLTVAPVVIITMLGLLYERFGQIGALRGALAGLGAAAAGLVFATAAQMAAPIVRKTPVTAGAIIAAAFVLAGLLRWPLVGVLAILAPVGVGLAWRTRPRS
jgi:chromate transporter